MKEPPALTNELNQWRRMTRQELAARGFSPKSERYLNRFTGEDVSRRGFENVRAQDAGFANYSQFQRVKTDPMYQVFERIRSTERGGVPIKELRTLSTVEGQEFNRYIADSIVNGQWQPNRTERLMEYLGLTAPRQRSRREAILQAFGRYALEIGRRRLRDEEEEG